MNDASTPVGEKTAGTGAQSDRMPASSDTQPSQRAAPTTVVRMDTHVHTNASSGSALAALGLLGVPECYTTPEQVYDRARARGMDLVTITDHDTIDGAMSLVERGFEDLIVGEEVTTHFSEDRCKMHVLVWGLTPELHEQIHALGLRNDIYDFAHWLKRRNLAHSLAHPLYDQNARLGVRHVERCALLFKCFETLNGGHDASHRDTIERFCRSLSPRRVLDLANRHDLEPVWPRCWQKGLTGGSDDHADLHIGRTWTEIDLPADGEQTPGRFLAEVMATRCRARGEGGHAARLAHQFMGVGAQFAAKRYEGQGRARTRIARARLLRFAGVREREPGRVALAVDTLRKRLLEHKRRSHPLVRALREALPRTLERYPDLGARLDPQTWTDGPPFSRHEEMERFVSDLCGAVSELLSERTLRSIARNDRVAILNHAMSYAMLEVAQMPYVYSMFQQNKERWLAERLRETLDGHVPIRDRPIRVALFTDTLGDVNGVTRFIRTMGSLARSSGRELNIITSTNMDVPGEAYIHNLRPRFAAKMPRYDHLEIVLPPILDALRVVDHLQPDVIHVSTPGPVGVLGLIASSMKRVPVVGTYHTDFPAYVEDLFDDHVMTRTANRSMKLFYRRFSTVLTRSSAYLEPLRQIGVDDDRLEVLPAGCDTEAFNPRWRDEAIWERLGVGPGVKVIYCGRVSVEKNLNMLTDVWTRASRRLADLGVQAQLVVVGDGPYRARMARELARTPATFLGFRHAEELSALYASGDVFVFPSLTDTLGQAVMEAQASGLPAIVSDAGGPKEIVEHDHTGLVVAGSDVQAWVEAVVGLARDRDRREGMGAAALAATDRYSNARMFEHFWGVHERAWQGHLDRQGLANGTREATPERVVKPQM